jgi:two-component system cell cycle sensor histidine kinase/response regulator CckA
MKILLVDDELHVAASVRPALGGNYRMESVTDGREAFDLLNEKPGDFDLVITDHMMPGWAGAELIKRLQVAGFPGRYMVLSAYMSPEIERIYRALGVDHIIRKPFDLDELRLAVSQIEQSIDEAGD